jgi:hypothetical protein
LGDPRFTLKNTLGFRFSWCDWTNSVQRVQWRPYSVCNFYFFYFPFFLFLILVLLPIRYGFDILNWQANSQRTKVGFVDRTAHVTFFSQPVWSDNTTNIPCNFKYGMLPLNSPHSLFLLFLSFFLKKTHSLAVPRPPSSALIIFIILAAIFLFVLVGMFAIGLCISPAPTNDYLTFHIPNAVGAILGYTAVIFIFTDDSKCLAVPILVDLSLLICGGLYQTFFFLPPPPIIIIL